MEPIIGIDLGTTYSEAAYIFNGQAKVIKGHDNGIFPSCVGLDSNDGILVGMEAKNQYAAAPDRTVVSIKRWMGSDKKLCLGDNDYLPQEISAFILTALKRDAEKALGMEISRAVITVPAYFTDSQRQATREAGRIAGLDVTRIINEPTAASLAYESNSRKNQKILVYDLGGGTFDVSIVSIEEGVVEVLASTGDNNLGGDDFDNKIADLLVEHIKNEMGISVKNDQKVTARLKQAAEAAKIRLSTAPYAKIEEDHIGKKGVKDLHLSYEISRTKFQELIEDDLQRTMDSVSKALRDAAMLPSAIDKIILVGGSTRIPLISEMLKEKLGKQPHGEVDADLCVALGAAIQAGMEMGMDVDTVLVDITPYTFGTSALGQLNGMPYQDQFVPIINRNTKLPATKGDSFFTVYDNQEAVEITVYQGENPDALQNVLIGKFMFHLTPAPAGSALLTTFSLDLNGILKVHSVEKETGKEIEGVVENAISQFSEKDITESKRKIEGMWGENERVHDDAGSEADDKIRTELPADMLETLKQAEEELDNAPLEDRDEMVNLMEDIKEAAKENRMDEAREKQKELDDILFYLG